ncbi:hypothetical protein QYF36_010303 [Acer negundo]|nr:hypothetical protein QYF36_010303 [Acer negundo]
MINVQGLCGLQVHIYSQQLLGQECFHLLGALGHQQIKLFPQRRSWSSMQVLHRSIYMIALGITEIFLSQIPNFDKLSWLSTVAEIVSFGCLGYAVLGNQAPGNLLTGFGFYEPFWLISSSQCSLNIVTFQVVAQPVFNLVEMWAGKRLTWRTLFVVIIAFLAFFNEALALPGAIAYWSLIDIVFFQWRGTFPETRSKEEQSSGVVCLIAALGAACSSIQGMISKALHTYKPFKSTD